MSELQSHFKMDHSKIMPQSSSIIQGDKYRFTVLSDLLIRLEYSETGTFEDRATELVINRKFNPINFEYNDMGNFLTIKTKYFTLAYQKNKPFQGGKVKPEENLKVELNNSDKSWYYGHPEARNFKGTSYSLDDINGKVEFEKSLYSTDGFVSIDDSKSLLFNDDGSLGKRNDERYDIYLFMYRRDFGACLKDYFTLTGFPPLIPRYILGTIWNRNIEYSSKDIEQLVYNFEKHKIPLSVIMLSDKWHKNNKMIKSGFSFNDKLFKKPKRLSEYLHDKGIRLSVKVDPFEGISENEDYFDPFKKASGLEGDRVLPFNVFNKNVLTAYFDYFIHPLMNNGVDFFWIDYNNKKDLVSLRALTHYHFYDYKQIENRRGIVMARNGLIAAHRYPIHYTGQMMVSWDNLKKLPTYNSNASNIGLSWISNDIGGYYDGVEDGELYARYVQLGCFSPILRLSCDEGKFYKREPWRWDITTSSIVTDYLRLRNSLIPYIYSEAYRYSKVGLPIVEPLYYTYPEIYDEPLYKNEYYFGSSLLVAPIVEKIDTLIDRSIVKIFLPEGTWYDIKSGKKYNGGRRYTTFYKKEDYPVFAKSGTILPLTVLDDNNLNDTTSPKVMEIEVFPGESNTYELYEDDGISSLHEKGFYLLTNIDYSYNPGNIAVIIRPVSGKSGIIPKYRSYRIRLRNVKEPDEVLVNVDGEKVKGVNAIIDDNDFIIDLPALLTTKQITITCRGKDIEIDGTRLINDDMMSILSDLPIETRIKNAVGEVLLSDIPTRKKRIEVRKLRKLGVNPKYINLFLKLLEYLDEV